ncbi:hypothetical protein [Paraburkholderia sp. SIMBA_054]
MKDFIVTHEVANANRARQSALHCPEKNASTLGFRRGSSQAGDYD